MLDFMVNERICVVGLGYVGLPLAIALGKHGEVIGFDVSKRRIDQLKAGHDWSLEESAKSIQSSKILFTTDPEEIKKATFVIVCVPTPVTRSKVPDLSPVISAGEIIGKNLSKGAVVVLESTVYPGTTEEVLVPVIDKCSGFVCGKDYFVGYSPERINPGDKEHSIDRVIKVVSGMNGDVCERVASVYKMICAAGVFKAASIKAAEAAKVIENVQRDLNIALMNELSLIFHKVGIRTKDVLDAAGTKWNFLRFSPGLVGGHCIGVDPYYLTFKAQDLGYDPELILAGRRVNEGMSDFVVSLLLKLLNSAGKAASKSTVLVLGLPYKENVKDCRNSRLTDIISRLKELGSNVVVFDPLLLDEPDLVKHEFGVALTPLEQVSKVDIVLLAVPHKAFSSLSLEKMRSWMDKPLLLDLRSFYDRKEAEKLGFMVESL